ncbi:hypothetical protein ACFWQ1_05675 [Streptomyces albidoflavus]
MPVTFLTAAQDVNLRPSSGYTTGTADMPVGTATRDAVPAGPGTA